MMIDPNCAVQLGTHEGPYFGRTGHDPTWRVCNRHRQQYDQSGLTHDDEDFSWYEVAPNRGGENEPNGSRPTLDPD